MRAPVQRRTYTTSNTCDANCCASCDAATCRQTHSRRTHDNPPTEHHTRTNPRVAVMHATRCATHGGAHTRGGGGGGGGDARAAAAAASTTTNRKCPVTRRTCSTRAPWQAPYHPRDQSRSLHARRDRCGEHPADIARRHDTSAVARHPRHPHQSTSVQSARKH